jgi:transcriptional regulator with XRE-family HTH domain
MEMPDRLSGVPGPAAVLGTVSDKTFARAVGEELRRVREARGLTRLELVEQTPSQIGDRTLLAYEHGVRQMSAFRLVELCQVLKCEAPTVLTRGLQRARLYLENLPLQVDLNALLRDVRTSGTYRPLAQWTRNTLNEHPSGVARVESTVVRNLALFMGCTHQNLADYLARFLPDDAPEPEVEATEL